MGGGGETRHARREPGSPCGCGLLDPRRDGASGLGVPGPEVWKQAQSGRGHPSLSPPPATITCARRTCARRNATIPLHGHRSAVIPALPASRWALKGRDLTEAAGCAGFSLLPLSLLPGRGRGGDFQDLIEGNWTIGPPNPSRVTV